VNVTEIKVSYGKTKNLGNYESARADVELTVVVQEGDDVNELIEKAQLEAKRHVHKELGL